MNLMEAKAKAEALYGPTAFCSVDGTAISGQERKIVRAAVPDLVRVEQAATQARKDRLAQLLEDPLYQQLLREERAAQAALFSTRNKLQHRRVIVGYQTADGFRIEGQGDTYEQALRSAEKRLARQKVGRQSIV